MFTVLFIIGCIAAVVSAFAYEKLRLEKLAEERIEALKDMGIIE